MEQREVSVVIPARDEEENIGLLVENLRERLGGEEIEIIVVDDHSSDGTARIVRQSGGKGLNIRLVENRGEPGFANALRAGFERAEGRFIVPVMADSCDRLETILEMREKARRGYDLVCGSRYMKGGRREGGPLVQGMFSRLVGETLHVLAGIPTRDVANSFKLYRRRFLEGITLAEKGFAVSMEAALKFFFNGGKIAEVPTVWSGREKGASKFKMSRTFPYVALYIRAVLLPWTFRS